LVDALG